MKKPKITFVLLLACFMLTETGCSINNHQSISTKEAKQTSLLNTKRSQHIPSFNNINMDITNAKVTVEEGKNFAVTYYSRKNDKPTVTVNRNCLWISQKPQQRKSYYLRAILKITVPAKTKLEQFKFKGTCTSLNLNKLYIKQSNIVSNDNNNDGHGDNTLIKNSTILQGKLYDNVGVLTVKNSNLHSLKINNSIDDVDFKNVLLDNSELTCACGDISIVNAKITHGYKVIAETGDISIKNAKTSGFYSKSGDENQLFDQENDSDDGSVLKKGPQKGNVLKVYSNYGTNEIS
ncbi:DUF4097 family beta strand repeat-containing protein [Lactobacillus sp. ESL0677]|uniref:DUF4097 family beta strand repeat-containing protein n=1 Tax=Lactobacillus sp. ESL0677 TaxID=2983208 RepID=UPI0023F8A2F5|nr:DUF4097 family beta strand repeat-containing protein [Lactobacillus sp. ESL0677]WEV37171.1 DUF4097 family beta strand repeat-containing protein [Lactobacillus sp. ESL0677]